MSFAEPLPSAVMVAASDFPDCFLPNHDRKDQAFPHSGASLPSAHQALQASFLEAAQANLVCTLLTTAHVTELHTYPICLSSDSLRTLLARSTRCFAISSSNQAHNPSSNKYISHIIDQSNINTASPFCLQIIFPQAFPTCIFPLAKARKAQCLRPYYF